VAGSDVVSALDDHVADYLRLRRQLGFKLERAGRLLPQLVAYLEAAGASTVTRELAIVWARLPAGARPTYWAARLSIARGFAAYLQTIDPATEVPPVDVFGARYRRPTPYLWSPTDIRRLLEAARAAPAVASGDVGDAVRATRGDRHAGRRGARARPRRC
jgi:integrase/recombinase XerD